MANALKRGSNSAEVGDLQNKLNKCGPTRLPLLNPDNDFGVLTKARVMEFQFNQGLHVDGAAGPATRPRLDTVAAKAHSTTQPQGRSILVNLVHNKLIAFLDGTPAITIQPIHGGSPSAPSTQGVFPMSDRRLRHHTSSEFPEPDDNMQFAMFYHKGEALHLGPPTISSEGCIHVGLPGIERLFNFVGKSDELVIVVKP